MILIKVSNSFVSNSFVLKDFCTVKTNFPDADFWLIRKGSEDKVGLPVRVFSDEHIGVRVDSSDLLDSGYLFYYLSYLNSAGYFKALSRGMSALQNIIVSDVENKEISIFDDPKKDFTKRFLEEKQVAKLRILKEERHKRRNQSGRS